MGAISATAAPSYTLADIANQSQHTFLLSTEAASGHQSCHWMGTWVTIPDLMAPLLSEKKELRPRGEGKLSQIRSLLRGRGGFGPKALETSKSPVI